MGSIAWPSKHREQYHHAREDETQGTMEETEDAPEGSGANISVELGSEKVTCPRLGKTHILALR